MELAVIGTLIVLALIDGTSLGTLGIPLWLTLQPGVRPRTVATYLAAIAVFYWLVGLVLLGGALTVFTSVLEATEGEARLWAQLVLGITLFALAFVVDPIGGRKERPEGHGSGRMARLKARVSGEGLAGRSAVWLAIGAATVELATMLPYLAAIGWLVEAAPGAGVSAGVLLVYCGVMVLPAVILLGARVVAERRAAGLLATVQAWVERHSAQAVGLVLLLAGLYLGGGAAQELEVFGAAT